MSTSALQWILLPVFLLIVFWVILKLYRRRRSRIFSFKRDSITSHRWQRSEFASKPTYCNSCRQYCLSGSRCQTCGTCVCRQTRCLSFVCQRNACKPLATEKTGHTWRHGNLPLASKCYKCLLPCGDVPALADYICIWCDTTVHEECIDADSNQTQCSFGVHRRLIIPPTSVSILEEGSWKVNKKLVIKRIKTPNIERWDPLIVFSNTKSGGKDGEHVMNILRRLLNPVQVVDLNAMQPELALEMCRMIPADHTVKILVCGGDGTVGWILGAIDKSNLPVKPHVGILPLGTGNDLARVLGWGPGYSIDDDISEVLNEVEHAQLSILDRWQVVVTSKRRYFGLHKKVLVMNNYIGIGCGAGVALNFHRRRQSYPDLFASRFINKMWYFGLGAQDFITPTSKNLQNKIEIYIDGIFQELPELEGVVILNINSWSSGCCMWSPNEEWGPSRMDDKLLEVVGLYSSFHVGRIQISVAEPLRIGQSNDIKIILKESVAVQVDGEPWQQGPSTITISHKGQINMLKKVNY